MDTQRFSLERAAIRFTVIEAEIVRPGQVLPISQSDSA